MRWFRRLIALVSVSLVLAATNAADFKLITGDVYRGELSAADDDGIVVRLETGEFSPRIDWAKLSDETLRQLLDNPRAKPFAEPLVEPTEVIIPVRVKEIAVRPVVGRVPLPEGVKKGLLSSLMTPNGLIVLIALFFANLYTAYEVARFKWRPVALVCGLSAVLPVLGWLIFLILPRMAPAEQESATEAAVAGTSVSVGGAGPSANEAPRGGAAAALGLSKAAPGHGGGGGAEGGPKLFKRGETTFNRRFFETQFPTFFRVIGTEADKDQVIDVSAGRSSVVASRISRISATEIHFKTANNQEVGVNFSDITQVSVRHKDAS